MTEIEIATEAMRELYALGEIAQESDDLEVLQDAVLGSYNRIQRLCAGIPSGDATQGL
jgi:hypothetical protein